MVKFSETMTDRTVSQYNDSPIFLDFLSSLALLADDLQDEISRVNEFRQLKKAQGVNLDTIGRIVGVDRVVIDFQVGVFFGFEPDPTALGFDSVDEVVTNAGRYREIDEPTGIARFLGDDEYRTLITAKILSNTSNITPDAVLLITRATLEVMFGQGSDIPIYITELGNASFELQVVAELNPAEQAFITFLDLIPRPAGVKINFVYETPPNNLLTEDGLVLFYQDGTTQEIQF